MMLPCAFLLGVCLTHAVSDLYHRICAVQAQREHSLAEVAKHIASVNENVSHAISQEEQAQEESDEDNAANIRRLTAQAERLRANMRVNLREVNDAEQTTNRARELVSTFNSPGPDTNASSWGGGSRQTQVSPPAKSPPEARGESPWATHRWEELDNANQQRMHEAARADRLAEDLAAAKNAAKAAETAQRGQSEEAAKLQQRLLSLERERRQQDEQQQQRVATQARELADARAAEEDAKRAAETAQRGQSEEAAKLQQRVLSLERERRQQDEQQQQRVATQARELAAARVAVEEAKRGRSEETTKLQHRLLNLEREHEQEEHIQGLRVVTQARELEAARVAAEEAQCQQIEESAKLQEQLLGLQMERQHREEQEVQRQLATPVGASSERRNTSYTARTVEPPATLYLDDGLDPRSRVRTQLLPPHTPMSSVVGAPSTIDNLATQQRIQTYEMHDGTRVASSRMSAALAATPSRVRSAGPSSCTAMVHCLLGFDNMQRKQVIRRVAVRTCLNSELRGSLVNWVVPVSRIPVGLCCVFCFSISLLLALGAHGTN